LKQLVVTGDDFGFSTGVNRAILEAHRRGILTNASLMVDAAAAAEAIDMARAHPTLAVGLHLVLVDGRSERSARFLPHLVDANRRFRGGPVRSGLRYALHPAARRELRLEIRAQLERFRQTGLRLSHVDGHHHLHLHPVVLGILLDLADEFQIPAIRLPSEELGLTLAVDRTGLVSKLASSAVFRLLRGRAEARLRAEDVGFADRVYGLLATGKMTESYLLHIIPRIRAGRVELYSHPSLEEPGEPLNGPPGSGRQELAALLSPRVRESLDLNGFQLATDGEANHRFPGRTSREIASRAGSPRADSRE